MFRIIGAADAAANLLANLKLLKKDAIQTNIKNGKVILVNEIASSIFFVSPINLVQLN